MYPLTLDLVDFLLGDTAQLALRELALNDLSQHATLSLLAHLRQQFDPNQAAALLDQARMRQRAGDKFSQPNRLFFTDEGLQQASSRAVATYRAQQFAALGASSVSSTNRHPPTAISYPLFIADLGCGLGADSIAFAEAGLHVLAVERDPIRARIAQANIAALGLANRVEIVEADWTALFPLPLPSREGAGGRVRIPPAIAAAFVDPSRRRGDRRIFRLADMEPPLSAVLALLEYVPTVAVKTMPGIADDDIPLGAEVEFISEQGAMKEALLRFGDLRTGAARRATLLPGPHHLDSNAPVGAVPLAEPQAHLYEPGPAILRATLVQHLATQLGAAQLDPTIAYLTTDLPVETPFARGWQVLRHGPFGLKLLNQWLRELAAGEVVVKKRGSAIDPDDFRRRLKTTPGGPCLTVFLTRVQGRPWMVVGTESDVSRNVQRT